MDLDNISEEELKMLMELGVIPEEQALLQDQMNEALQLRSRAGPEGREAGRVYTAANPLEHIGEFMQKRNAGKELEGLRTQQGGLLDKQAEQRAKFYQMLRGQRPGATPPASTKFGPQPYTEGDVI